jgi:hypothetical protein
MIFDGDARRWARLEQISWNAGTRQLRFFVPPGFGVAEREYEGTLVGSDLAGNVNELGAVQGWQAIRAWLEGTWTGTDLWQALSFTASRRWEAPLPAGVPDRWVGEGFASGQASEWTGFAAVRFAAPNVQLWLFDESALGAPDFNAVLAGTTLQGTGPLGRPWTVTRASDDVLN